MDRRLHPANARVAHSSLQGRVSGVAFTEGTDRQITQGIANVLAAPNGALDRQLLRGDVFVVLETLDGFAFGFEKRTGYVGYVAAQNLGACTAPSHRVTTLGAHLYPDPNIKTIPRDWLPFAAEITATPQGDDFFKTADGYIHEQHLSPCSSFETDPVSTAERLIGVPYLWGGDSNQGLDCSGLVHLGHKCAGRTAPRDSDQQAAGFGVELKADDPLQRGDLIFWKGHVGLMQDAETLIHANGFHMAVVSEPLASATTRIAQTGGGGITIRRRP